MDSRLYPLEIVRNQCLFHTFQLEYVTFSSTLRHCSVSGGKSVAMNQLKDDSLHVCKLCNKTFSKNHNLKRHIWTHYEPRFNCSVKDCDQKFHRKDVLNDLNVTPYSTLTILRYILFRLFHNYTVKPQWK